MHPEYKICRVCGETKPLSDFYAKRTDCKVCNIAKARRWQAANPEQVLVNKRAFYQANPEKHRAWMAPHRGRLTRAWRDRYPDKYELLNINTLAAERGATERISLDEYYAVRARCEDRCQICGTTERITWDHIVALKDGGPHRPENLQLLCLSCNARKGNREKLARR